MIDKIFITCSVCKQDRLVATNGMLKASYEKTHPCCHKCGFNKDKCSKTWFNKGLIPWNIGIRYKNPKVSIANKGHHYSPLTEWKKGQVANEKNSKWKGDKVGYHALHRWLDRNFGKPSICEFCGEKNRIQWASKNYSYTRKREDWLVLCQTCHSKYDHQYGWGMASYKFPDIRHD